MRSTIMGSKKTFLLGALLAAAAGYLGACVGQPGAGCPVFTSSLGTIGSYWAQYKLVDAGVGACNGLTGELIGFQKYHLPGAPTTKLAFRNEGLANDVILSGRVDSTDGGEAKLNGFGTIPEAPGPDNFCEVTSLIAAEQRFDPVPSKPLSDGGIIPALPTVFKRYAFSKLKILASPTAPGSVATGTLSYTQDTCTATYEMLAVFQAVECDLAKNDPARKGYNLDCDPLPVLAENLHLTADGGLPDGGKPDLSHTAGAAINRAFATEDKPLTCQIYPASDPEVNLGGYCRPQLTADEISKL